MRREFDEKEIRRTIVDWCDEMRIKEKEFYEKLNMIGVNPIKFCELKSTQAIAEFTVITSDDRECKIKLDFAERNIIKKEGAVSLVYHIDKEVGIFTKSIEIRNNNGSDTYKYASNGNWQFISNQMNIYGYLLKQGEEVQIKITMKTQSDFEQKIKKILTVKREIEKMKKMFEKKKIL